MGRDSSSQRGHNAGKRLRKVPDDERCFEPEHAIAQPPEMFPNRIRGTALSVAASAQWVANFLVTLTLPILVASVGLMGAYGMYATFAVVSLLFVVRHITETKRRTLEKMSAQEPPSPAGPHYSIGEWPR